MPANFPRPALFFEIAVDSGDVAANFNCNWDPMGYFAPKWWGWIADESASGSGAFAARKE